MLGLNRVMVAGRLTRDPEVRQIKSGTTVGNFCLALNERITADNGDERDQVCFVDVEVWGRQADVCARYLAKGSAAFVEGKLRSNQWQDRDTGQRRKRLLVRAARVHFLDPPDSDDAEDRRGDEPRSRRGPRDGNSRFRKSSGYDDRGEPCRERRQPA